MASSRMHQPAAENVSVFRPRSAAAIRQAAILESSLIARHVRTGNILRGYRDISGVPGFEGIRTGARDTCLG